MASVELFVRKEYFKFNAAHFVIVADGREKLHGHNYTTAVRAVPPAVCNTHLRVPPAPVHSHHDTLS
jgi:hypothetical protein